MSSPTQGGPVAIDSAPPTPTTVSPQTQLGSTIPTLPLNLERVAGTPDPKTSRSSLHHEHLRTPHYQSPGGSPLVFDQQWATPCPTSVSPQFDRTPLESLSDAVASLREAALKEHEGENGESAEMPPLVYFMVQEMCLRFLPGSDNNLKWLSKQFAAWVKVRDGQLDFPTTCAARRKQLNIDQLYVGMYQGALDLVKVLATVETFRCFAKEAQVKWVDKLVTALLLFKESASALLPGGLDAVFLQEGQPTLGHSLNSALNLADALRSLCPYLKGNLDLRALSFVEIPNILTFLDHGCAFHLCGTDDLQERMKTSVATMTGWYSAVTSSTSSVELEWQLKVAADHFNYCLPQRHKDDLLLLKIIKVCLEKQQLLRRLEQQNVLTLWKRGYLNMCHRRILKDMQDVPQLLLPSEGDYQCVLDKVHRFPNTDGDVAKAKDLSEMNVPMLVNVAENVSRGFNAIAQATAAVLKWALRDLSLKLAAAVVDPPQRRRTRLRTHGGRRLSPKTPSRGKRGRDSENDE